MADNNIEEEQERLAKILAEAGINAEEHANNLKKLGKTDAQVNKEMQKLASAIEDAAKRYKKSLSLTIL